MVPVQSFLKIETGRLDGGEPPELRKCLSWPPFYWPDPLTTVGIVLANILASSQSDQLSM